MPRASAACNSIFDNLPTEGPACVIDWLVHVCERQGQSFTGRTVPKHLYPLSVRLAHSIVNVGLRRNEILAAATTLCRYRWRNLCLRSAHRSVVPYPHFPAKGPLYRDYSELLGEPYVSRAKVAAFGLICVDRAAAHTARGNTARAGFYATNANTVVDVFGKIFSTHNLQRERGRLGGKKARENAAPDVAATHAHATRLLTENEPKDVPRLIQKLTRQAISTIYRRLASHPSGHWGKHRVRNRHSHKPARKKIP
jgi:hypothetical protein